MSPENKAIAERLAKENKGTIDASGISITFKMPIESSTPITTVESWLIAIANEFKIQQLTWKWAQGMTLEEYSEGINLSKTGKIYTVEEAETHGEYVDKRDLAHPMVYWSQELFEKLRNRWMNRKKP